MSILQVDTIDFKFGEEEILQQISFTVEPLQKIAIIGESGSGKSTLLKIIGGYLQPNAGKILFNGNRVLGPLEQLLPGHKSIAYLSQQYELLNNYKVADLLEYNSKFSSSEDALICDLCNINGLLKRKTHQLSGGEKQRVATAKLLLSKPSVLLLDEPYSNLDAHHKQMMKQVIANISKHLQITILMASHEPTDILSWADEIVVIQQKKVVQKAATQQVYYRPSCVYVAGLLGRYNLLTKQQLHQLFFKVITEDEQFIVRPEHIQIKAPQFDGLKGTVVNYEFMGHYWMMHIRVHGILLQTIVTNPTYTIGVDIGIEINSNHIIALKQ